MSESVPNASEQNEFNDNMCHLGGSMRKEGLDDSVFCLMEAYRKNIRCRKKELDLRCLHINSRRCFCIFTLVMSQKDSAFFLLLSTEALTQLCSGYARSFDRTRFITWFCYALPSDEQDYILADKYILSTKKSNSSLTAGPKIQSLHRILF